jgi:hypothetical protein
VAKLVEGFETAYGLELLSTVYWVVKNEGASSIDQAREKIHSWNEYKKQFSEKQIAVAYQILQKQQWI